MFEMSKEKIFFKVNRLCMNKNKGFFGFTFVDMSAVLFHCHTHCFQITSIGRNLGFWGAMVCRCHELQEYKPIASH
jgi:hypothetical protein